MSDTGSTRVKLQGSDFEQIRHEAEQNGVPMCKILRDYTIEYIRLRNESKQASAGNIEQGSTIHTSLTGLEARIAKTVITNTERIDQLVCDIELIAAILDTFVKLYLNHTPEVAHSEREDRFKSMLNRHEKFVSAITYAYENNQPKIFTETKNLLYKTYIES